MNTSLAIDPGSERSAYVVASGGSVLDFAIVPNEDLRRYLRETVDTGWFPASDADEADGHEYHVTAVAIEQVEPRYGLQLGWETLDTARWVGRFQEAASSLPVHLLCRSQVLQHLGVVTTARKGEKRVSADAGVRQALIDRYGGAGGKAAAIGLKASPGPLYGISKDVWAALAVAVTWADTEAAP